MKLPFISRKRYEALKNKCEELEKKRGRTIAYVPVEYPMSNGKPVQIPGHDYCHHDGRIGWVYKYEFKDYDDYLMFLKNDDDYAKCFNMDIPFNQ